jgi:hypothetical protein
MFRGLPNIGQMFRGLPNIGQIHQVYKYKGMFVHDNSSLGGRRQKPIGALTQLR